MKSGLPIWLSRLIASGLALAVSGTIQGVSPAYASPAQPLSDLQVGELQQTVDQYRQVFGGLWGDPVTHLVTIKVAPGMVDQTRRSAAMKKISVVGTASDPKARTGPKRWHVRFSEAGPSLAILDAVMSKVTTAQPWAQDTAGIRVSWYIDPQLDKVVIGLEQITPRLVSEAQSSFGNLALLTVEERSVLYNRLLDSQPYWGSDRVSVNGGSCTAAFEAQDTNTGHYGLLTAGHCWSVGTIVKQGYYDSGGTLHASGTMGKVTIRSYGNNVVDGEFMDATSQGTRVQDYVWVGPDPPAGGRRVTSLGTSFVGLSECFDGSFTNENCSGLVDQVDVCAQFPTYYECHLDRAHSTNGSHLAQGGDSGGPVEQHDAGSGVAAYGTVTGGNSTEYYYSDLGWVLNALSVGLVVN